MDFLSNVFNILLLVLGFGFVIFWHELGHFLAAKWVGIRVEQFAVGMGHAILSYRKGIGWKWGNTRALYEKKVRQHLADRTGRPPSDQFSEREANQAADELGLGDTEYRLSWIPVGGYVKMLGQDDLDPNSRSDDPRSYNRKSVPQRMLVISAGVIMNIILAGILFMTLFMIGFNAPAPVVGNVLPGSPAQLAGIEAGDRILAFDGETQHDFTKITLNTALASPTRPLRISIEKPDGTQKTVEVQPVKPEDGSKSFLALGFTHARSLSGLKPREFPKDPGHPDLELYDRSIRPGDQVVAINGQPTTRTGPEDVAGGARDWAMFDRALQKSRGKPVSLTVKRASGSTDTIQVDTDFAEPFDLTGHSFNVVGLQPRTTVESISKKESPVFGKLKPGDVIQTVIVHSANAPANDAGDPVHNPARQDFVKLMAAAGDKNQSLDFTVLRNGQPVEVKGIRPTLKLESGNMGIGVATGYEETTPVVANVLEKSPADQAQISKSARITAIDARPVQSWYDVIDALAAAPGQHKVTLSQPNATKPVEKVISLSDKDVQELRNTRVNTNLALADLNQVRKTTNPAIALWWGVTETRDLILQFYVTLKRVFYERTVSPKNFMGPLGIFDAGAKFAFKGTDWLIWFLAMISANLAVVNFLPIPIVDGGHFIFLIIEKIQGKPPSKRVLETAQLLGLFFIIGVFLLVTYNDISRMFGH
jgi:regulator of sigma E protease